jgi:hypothetical protein
MHTRKKLSRLGLSVVTLLALPAAAKADPPSFGAGLFVGYNVQRAGLEWGVEGFSTFSSTPNVQAPVDKRAESQARRVGAGPLLQFAMLGLSDPRFTLALQFGSELKRDSLALTTEIGVTYRMGERGGFGVHTGVVPQLIWGNIAMRYQFLLNEAWFGVGARFEPTFGTPGFVEESNLPNPGVPRATNVVPLTAATLP